MLRWRLGSRAWRKCRQDERTSTASAPSDSGASLPVTSIGFASARRGRCHQESAMCAFLFSVNPEGFRRGRLIELWEKRPTGGSVSGVALGCLIRKACGARCSGEVIPARSHLEAWVNIWVRSAGLGLVLAGWLLVGGERGVFFGTAVDHLFCVRGWTHLVFWDTFHPSTVGTKVP